MKMEEKKIRLDSQTIRKLEAEARRTGAPQAEIVRRALRKHLDLKQKAS